MDKQRMSELNASNLSRLEVPTVPAGLHAMQLKQTLLANNRPDTTKKLSIKDTIMSASRINKKFLLPGVFASLAIVAILTVSSMAVNRPVSALQLAQQSVQSVGQLSSEARQEMNARLNANVANELTIAEQAKDLKKISYDDVRVLPAFADMPSDASAGTNLEKLHYLTFTDSEGATHIIGLNNDGLPEIIIVSSQSGSIKQNTFQIQDQNGNTTINGGSLQLGPGSQ